MAPEKSAAFLRQSKPEQQANIKNLRSADTERRLNIFYPFTEPAVTPLMMNLLRAMYTIITGRIASRMNM